MNSKEKALLICKYLSSKKAKGIVYIEVEQKTSLCDCGSRRFVQNAG